MSPGSVLLIYCNTHKGPSDKYVVVLTSDDPPLCLFINSRIHPLVSHDPDQVACHVQVTPQDLPFLTHISYINCLEPQPTLLRCGLVNQLTKDPARIKGQLSGAPLAAVRSAIRGCRTIPDYDKGRILAALPSV